MAVVDEDVINDERIIPVVADLQEPSGRGVDPHKTVVVQILVYVDTRIGIHTMAHKRDLDLRMDGII